MDFRRHAFVHQPGVQMHEVQRRKQSICGIQGGKEDKEEDYNIESFMTNFSNVYASDLLPSKYGNGITEYFLLEVVDILLHYIRKTFDEESKMLDFHHPQQLLEGLDGFNIELSDQPKILEQLLVDCRNILKYGVKTGYPRFFNQLSSGLDMIGLAGEWLTATANTNMFTYEISPVFIVMEMILLKKMQEIIGWGEIEADGTFSPGESISNLYSILVARYKMFLEIKTKGMAVLPQIVLFVSEHHGMKRIFQPLGNTMDLATAGTTVYGAFDPLDDIADVCEGHSLWMHVDGTYGFEAQINTFMELADYLYKILKKKENFVFDAEPELTNVCFWYIPPRLKSVSNEYERQQELQKIALKIKALMIEEGTTMVSYQPHGNKVNFFQMVFSNPATKQSDVDFVIDKIERLGKAL